MGHRRVTLLSLNPPTYILHRSRPSLRPRRMIGHPHTHPTATHTADDPMFGWVGAAPGAMNDMGMS